MKVWRVSGMALLALWCSACGVMVRDNGTLADVTRRAAPVAARGAAVATTPMDVRRAYETAARSDNAAVRADALRRLADLENETLTDATVTSDTSIKPDYRRAIGLYEELLKARSGAKDNDRIYYQLARAYDQNGDLEHAIVALTRLVTDYPRSRYYAEAQFRRGEMAFILADYDTAEQAYLGVVELGKRNLFFERSIYKLGWSYYKREKYPLALREFFKLIDTKLSNRRLEGDLKDFTFLTQGDKEVIKDVLRAISLTVSNLEGPKALPGFFSKERPPNWEAFIYQSVADLYLSQERYLDAAETLLTFGTQRPANPRGLLMAQHAIEIYQQRGYPPLVLVAKRDLVQRYAAYTEYWATHVHHDFAEYLINADDDTDQKISAYVGETLVEIGKHYHAIANASHSAADLFEAIKWYKTFLKSYPRHAEAAEINFLLAEALFLDHRYQDAITEYERCAYVYTQHPRGAEAGYAALVAYDEMDKRTEGEDQTRWRNLALQSADRYVTLYASDPRSTAVMARLVADLVAANKFSEAEEMTRRLTAATRNADAAAQRRALTALANGQYEQGDFVKAAQSYAEAVKLTEPNDPVLLGLADHLAAAMYKNAEVLRARGDLSGASTELLRIGVLAPTASIRPIAEFDAATDLINLHEWERSIPLLEGFASRYPNHKLSAAVGEKLAVAYLQSGNAKRAAQQFEKLSAHSDTLDDSREAIWKSAELYERAGELNKAVDIYRRYLERFPAPLDPVIETYQHLVTLYTRLQRPADAVQARQSLLKVAPPTGVSYGDASRATAARIALQIATEYFDTFTAIKLVNPLKENLKHKQALLNQSVQAYGDAAAYRVSEVTTAATYRIGQLYQAFGKALLTSERPTDLSPEALEQYELVLEDQADPFAEKAIQMHELNTQRVGDGIYDQWVQHSYTVLAELLPARYNKPERGEVAVDAR